MTTRFETANPGWGTRIGTVTRRMMQTTVIGLPIILLILLIFYPLTAITLLSIFPKMYAATPSFVPQLDMIGQVLGQRRTYTSIFNSLWLSVATAVLTCALGTILAILTDRTTMPLRRVFRLLAWVVFFTPSYMLGEAWTLVLIHGSIPDQYLHFSNQLINTFLSPLGVILVLSLKGFPITYLSVSAALQGLGSEFEEAARISGARPLRSWLSINIPLLLPAILAGGILAFADSVSDFGTAATIAQNASVPLITYQMYIAIDNAPVDFSQAATLSLLLFGLTALALAIQSRILRAKSFQVISGRTRPAHRVNLGRWNVLALFFCIILFMLALFIPATMSIIMSVLHAFGRGLTPSNLTLEYYMSAIKAGANDLTALGRSFGLSVGAATVASLIGLPIAFIIRRTTLPGRRILSFLTIATVAVPGLVLACGYIFAWNSPYLTAIGIGTPKGFRIYGTAWVLLFVYIASGLPLAARLGIGALDQIGQSLLETARIQGANVFQLLVRVVAPLMRSSLISTWLLVFSGSMFALATSELLFPPSEPTAAVTIIKYFNDTRYSEGMAMTVLTVIAVSIMLLMLRAVPWVIARLRRYKRKMRGPEPAATVNVQTPVGLPAIQ